MTTTITTDIARFGDKDLRLGSFRLTTTGLTVIGKPSVDEWRECGTALRRLEGAVQFWIGDWLVYGESRQWGEKYTEAVATLGLENQTLRVYAYVARNVELLIRINKLGFSIHREVSHLPPAAQGRILKLAAENNLSVVAVRELVRAEAHTEKVGRITRGELPRGEYDIVCADPPWAYSNSGFEQSAAEHYPTMTVDEICGLPQTDPTFPRVADPCVLFLWATSPLVPEATIVMATWGFTYKACLVWVKDRAPGLGWWLNTRHELLLVGVRGSSLPVEKVDSVIEASVEAHSRKPLEAYAAIDRMFPPGLRRVECFARAPRPGWDCWGHEV